MIDIPIVVWPPGTGFDEVFAIWYQYGCSGFGPNYQDCSTEYLSQYPGAIAVCCYVV